MPSPDDHYVIAVRHKRPPVGPNRRQDIDIGRVCHPAG
jgi:hypothetical protein